MSRLSVSATRAILSGIVLMLTLFLLWAERPQSARQTWPPGVVTTLEGDEVWEVADLRPLQGGMLAARRSADWARGLPAELEVRALQGDERAALLIAIQLSVAARELRDLALVATRDPQFVLRAEHGGQRLHLEFDYTCERVSWDLGKDEQGFRNADDGTRALFEALFE